MDTFQIDDRHGKLYFMDDSTNKKVYLTVDKNGNLVQSNPTKIYAKKGKWEEKVQDLGYMWSKKAQKFIPNDDDDDSDDNNDNDDDDYDDNSGSSNKKRKKSTDELVYNSTKKERIAALEFDSGSKSGLVAFYGNQIRYLLVDKKGNLMYDGTGLFLKNGDWEEKVESLRCRWSKSKKKFIRDNNNNDDNDNDDGNSGSSNKKGKQSKNDTVYEDTKNKKIKQISFDSEKDCLCAIYMHHLWIFTVDEYGNLVDKNKKNNQDLFLKKGDWEEKVKSLRCRWSKSKKKFIRDNNNNDDNDNDDNNDNDDDNSGSSNKKGKQSKIDHPKLCKYNYKISNANDDEKDHNDDEVYSIELDSETKVKTLKQKLAKKHDVNSWSNIKILFAGKDLLNKLKLSSLKIGNTILFVYISRTEDVLVTTAHALQFDTLHPEYDSSEYDSSKSKSSKSKRPKSKRPKSESSEYDSSES